MKNNLQAKIHVTSHAPAHYDGGDEQAQRITEMNHQVYDYYYASEAYHHRYPVPNASTLRFILENGGDTAHHILDFGCGNGRYALPLLSRCHAKITGYDISLPSLDEFKRELKKTHERQRVILKHEPLENLGTAPSYDLILMMFGVLSHIGCRNERLRTLRTLHALMLPGGKLILSVPNVLRRRPIERIKTMLQRLKQKPDTRDAEPSNIYFTRKIEGRALTFFYHLYSIDDLRDDLAEAGFGISICKPESLLPEWMVTQYRIAAWLDRMILPILPTSLGYGLCVCAEAR